MLLFEYVQSRRIDIEMELKGRRYLPARTPIRERLGKALITLGEHLAPSGASQDEAIRPAA